MLEKRRHGLKECGDVIKYSAHVSMNRRQQATALRPFLPPTHHIGRSTASACSSLINKRGGVVLVGVLVLVGAVIVVGGGGGGVVVDTDLVYGVSQYGYCKHSCGKLACFRVRDASNNSFRSVNVVMTAIFAVVATTVAVVHTAATTDTAAFIRLERMRVPAYIPKPFRMPVSA